MLRLRTFGGLSLYGPDGPVTGAATQRRRLALLALLTSARDQGLARDKLVAYLWPDGDSERARHALAQLVYAVRKDHGEQALVVTSTAIRLNADVITSDVAEFEQALARGDVARAAALYLGPFLDGFYLGEAGDFDRWVEEERARLAQRATAALETLARDAGVAGDNQVAVAWWRRLAALEPLNARAAVGLMRALADAGDRSGALQHARVHETLVRQELDAAPDPAVAALAERLREEQQADAAGPAARPAAAAPAIPTAAAPTAAAPTAATASASYAPDESAAPDTGTHRSAGRRSHRATPVGVPMPEERSPRRRVLRIAPAAAVVALAAAALLGAAAMLHARHPRGSAVPVIAVGLIGDYTEADTARLARALRDMLATNLARAPGFRVVSNARMYEILGQGGERETDAAAMARAARQAGATDVVEGALYRRRDGSLRFDVRRVQLSSGAVRAAYTVEGADPFELVDRATARLASDLRVRADTLRVADVTTMSITAYRLYAEGLRLWYQHSDGPAALRLFAAALAEDSTFAMAAYYAGVIEIALGTGPFENPHLAQAVRMADRATDRERLLIRATWLLQFGEPAGLAVAETLAARYPTEPDAYYLLAEILMARGDFLGAVRSYRRVIAMDSLAFRSASARCRACDAYGEMGLAYQQADSLPAAERVGREYARLRPNSAIPLGMLEGSLALQGRYDEARAVWRAAGRLEPRDPAQDALWEARLDVRAANFAAADSLLARLLRDTALVDLHGEALWLETTSLRYQGRLAEALAAARWSDQFAARRATPPARPQPSMLDAQVLFEMGRPREAAALFALIAAHPPFEPWRRGKVARHRAWYLTHVATSLAAAGDTGRLEALAGSVEEIGPLSSYGRDWRLHHHIRGLLLTRRGDPAEAEAEFRQAIYSPTFGYTRTNLELGRLLLAERRPREAAAVVAPALRGQLDASNLYVTHTELHELLAQAYDAAGEPDSAAAHYRWVVNAWRRADRPFRPRWEAARARLAALESSRPPGTR